jgi:anti-sigma B factor antagonist
VDPEDVPFSIELAEGPDGAIVRPHGELDLATQQELRDALAAHAGPGTLTLDLSALRFLDTSGLRLILETAEAARRDGASFAVLPGPEAVQRLFEIAGVVELVPFREPGERGAS